MAWKATIAGVDRTTKIEEAEFDIGQTNARATAQITLIKKPGFLPNRFDEFVAYAKDGVTAIFGGLILTRSVRGIEANNDDDYVSFECGDFGTYSDFQYATLTYTVDVALEDVVDDLVSGYLATYGITYTPTATGITLAAFSWTDKRVSDALRELSDRSGKVFRFLPTKALILSTPGSASAPVSLTDAESNANDISWSDTSRIPANTIILYCGEGTRAATSSFVATGAETSWGTVLPATNDVPTAFYLNGTGVPIGPYEPGDPASIWAYQWDPVTHSIYQRSGDAPAVVGTTLQVDYIGQYPFRVTSTSGASPEIQLVLSRPDVFAYLQGQEIADGLLTQYDQQPKEITVLTDVDGFDAGQELAVALTPRSLTGDFVISKVSASLERGLADSYWKYTLLATDVFQGTYLDQWRELTGGSASGGGSISSGGGVSVTTLGSPAYLGGSRRFAVEESPAAWVPVPEYVPFTAPGSFSALLRVWLFARSAGVSVTARLYDVTAAAVVGTTTSVTSQTATERTIGVSITAGHVYRLELLAGTNSESVFGLGQLESL